MREAGIRNTKSENKHMRNEANQLIRTTNAQVGVGKPEGTRSSSSGGCAPSSVSRWAVGLAMVLVGSSWLQAAVVRFDARSGSKMRIEGTSNVHDWQVESPLIGAFIEAGANFPVEAGQSVTPGKDRKSVV